MSTATSFDVSDNFGSELLCRMRVCSGSEVGGKQAGVQDGRHGFADRRGEIGPRQRPLEHERSGENGPYRIGDSLSCNSRCGAVDGLVEAEPLVANPGPETGGRQKSE